MKFIFTLLVILSFNLSSAQKTSSDDGLHFGTGIVISGLTYSLVYAKTKNKSKAFWYSLGLSTMAGLAKEVYDGYIITGRFDKSEFIATAAGGIAASFSFNIFTGKQKKKKEEKLKVSNL
ncbi:hypothetical protein [Winogradskyella flava]|uniref:Lipoprotein n=1 Tax=Winogradskyella flava TaxID=1884876 RepID=A0A842IUA2_9FLAO|nr:hypothetical protein [Winogradskyella flava]MBC2845336.1 hypothetical protein [Winogradskyella flava]